MSTSGLGLCRFLKKVYQTTKAAEARLGGKVRKENSDDETESDFVNSIYLRWNFHWSWNKVSEFLFFAAGKCESLALSTCSGLHYSTTWVPNYFQHQTQDEATLEIRKYNPIIQTNCSAELTLFLCSLYAPNCIPYAHNVPCKELCSRVKKQCVPRMRELGIKWPVSCSKFPRKADEPGCIGGHPTSSVTKTTPSKDGKKQVLLMQSSGNHNKVT